MVTRRIKSKHAARIYAALWRVRKEKLDPDKLRANLRKLYRLTFVSEGRKAIAEAISAVGEMDGPVDMSEADEVMDTLDNRLGVAGLGKRLQTESTVIVRDLFSLGARQTAAKYKLNLTDHKAIKILQDHDLIWIGDHNDKELMPKFREITTDVMQRGYSRRKLAEALSEGLGDVVDGDKDYWTDLADHTATKAREIGRIAGFEAAGIEQARVKAVLDGKTSEICRDMNGRIINVSHLSAQKEKILSATSVEELKKAAPWPRRFQEKTQNLPENIGLPPYHYRCRTTLFAILKPVKATAEFGDKMRQADKDHLDFLTPEEHFLRSRDLQKRAGSLGLNWDTGDWKDDVTKARMAKHGLGGFGDDPKEYGKRALDTVTGADEVLVQVYRAGRINAVPRIQYRYYCRKTGAQTVVDDSGQVRGCYPFANHERELARAKEKRLCLQEKI